MNKEILANIINTTLFLCIIASIVRWIFFAKAFGKNRFLFAFFGFLACAVGFVLTTAVLAAIFLNFGFNLLPGGVYVQSIAVGAIWIATIFGCSELVIALLKKRFSKRGRDFDLDDIGNPNLE